jgi:type IV secretory pathway VirB2 component (pilin)
VVVIALYLVFEGVRRKFLKYLNIGQLGPRARRAVELLGMIGTIARGVIFALAGILVIEAAVTHDSAKSGGIDKALSTLRGQPLGEVLLFIAALGLVVFGVYGLCEARWRKV